MDANYSIMRRIWRILYPPLIFIGIQFFIMIIAGVCAGMYYFMISSCESFSASQDMYAVMDKVLQFLTERSMLILLITSIASLALFLPIWSKTRARNAPVKNHSPAAVYLLTAGLFAAFNLIQMMIFTLTDVMKYFPSYYEVAELYLADSFLIQILAIGVAAPVAEELVFRGIVINRMNWLPGWACVLVQGALFGAVHMNLFQGLYAFAAGVLLGLVYMKFRSIIITMIGHIAYNLASMLLSELTSEAVVGIMFIFSVIVLPICAIFIILHKKAAYIEPDQDIMPAPVFVPKEQRTEEREQGSGIWL
jgi:membrane protease YdiL (CAAX protease family)